MKAKNICVPWLPVSGVVPQQKSGRRPAGPWIKTFLWTVLVIISTILQWSSCLLRCKCLKRQNSFKEYEIRRIWLLHIILGPKMNHSHAIWMGYHFLLNILIVCRDTNDMKMSKRKQDQKTFIMVVYSRLSLNSSKCKIIKERCLYNPSN